MNFISKQYSFDVSAQVPNCALLKPPSPLERPGALPSTYPTYKDQTHGVGFPRISWDSLSMNAPFPSNNPHIYLKYGEVALCTYLGSHEIPM